LDLLEVDGGNRLAIDPARDLIDPAAANRSFCLRIEVFGGGSIFLKANQCF
jgi:hypothetical protein